MARNGYIFLGCLFASIFNISRIPHRRIRRSHERLDKEIPLAEIGKQHSDRITAIAVECAALLKQAEQEGEEGAVDKAEATMAKVPWQGLDWHSRTAVPVEIYHVLSIS